VLSRLKSLSGFVLLPGSYSCKRHARLETCGDPRGRREETHSKQQIELFDHAKIYSYPHVSIREEYKN
jgi:hypothetical protein